MLDIGLVSFARQSGRYNNNPFELVDVRLATDDDPPVHHLLRSPIRHDGPHGLDDLVRLVRALGFEIVAFVDPVLGLDDDLEG